jgi:hypothetical protein
MHFCHFLLDDRDRISDTIFEAQLLTQPGGISSHLCIFDRPPDGGCQHLDRQGERISQHYRHPRLAGAPGPKGLVQSKWQDDGMRRIRFF